MAGQTLSLIALGALLCLRSLPSVVATDPTPCYAPDGSKQDSRYMPCISMQGVDSMCCRLNDTDPDICQPNGLCYWDNSVGISGNKQGYYRSLCTDKNWDTPNCLSKTVCDDDAGGRSDYATKLNTCPDGSYCCGDSNSCCTDDKMFNISATLVPIGSSSNSSSAPTVTTTITDDSGSGDQSKKLAIGLGVGVPLGILAIAAGGGGFFWGRRSMKSRYEKVQDPGMNIPVLGIGGHEVNNADSKPVYEADNGRPDRFPLELPAGRNES